MRRRVSSPGLIPASAGTGSIRLAVFIILLFISAPSFAGEVPKLAAEEKGVIQKIVKSTSLKKALKLTKVTKDDIDARKIVKSKLQYLLHLNNTWPLDKLKLMKQYLYLKRIHAIWTLPGLQDIRPLSLDKLFEEHSDDSYFLSALAFHNGDVEKKYRELKKEGKLDETDEGFFKAAIVFREQIRGSIKPKDPPTSWNYSGNIIPAFSKDGRMIAVGSASDNRIELIIDDSYSPTIPSKFLGGHEPSVKSLIFSSHGKYMASVGKGGTIKIWDVARRKARQTLMGPKYIAAVAFSPDGKYLVVGSADTKIRFLNVKTGQPFKVLSGHTEPIFSIAFSSDGKYLASTSYKMVKLWDVKDGKEIKSFKGHKNHVNTVAFSPDGKTIATGGADQTIRLWDVKNGKALLTLNGHQHEVNFAVFSPDGNFLVSGSEDSTIRLWGVKSGTQLKILEGKGNVDLVSVSSDGRYLSSVWSSKVFIPGEKVIFRWEKAIMRWELEEFIAPNLKLLNLELPKGGQR